MEFDGYIFLGVGVAISVLGFFLKKESKKTDEVASRISTVEMLVAKNDVRDAERWRVANKLMEDRREDVKEIYVKLEGKK